MSLLSVTIFREQKFFYKKTHQRSLQKVHIYLLSRIQSFHIYGMLSVVSTNKLSLWLYSLEKDRFTSLICDFPVLFRIQFIYLKKKKKLRSSFNDVWRIYIKKLIRSFFFLFFFYFMVRRVCGEVNSQLKLLAYVLNYISQEVIDNLKQEKRKNE